MEHNINCHSCYISEAQMPYAMASGTLKVWSVCVIADTSVEQRSDRQPDYIPTKHNGICKKPYGNRTFFKLDWDV